MLGRWVLRAFTRMGFTSKLIKYRNARKFSLRNALYTARYLLGIQHFDWWHLKFLDEVRRFFPRPSDHVNFLCFPFRPVSKVENCSVIAHGLNAADRFTM